MRHLNGNSFTVSLVVPFVFTLDEADTFLAAKSQDRPQILDALLQARHPEPEQSSYNAEVFYKAVGQAMVERREQQLKQLPETVPTNESQSS